MKKLGLILLATLTAFAALEAAPKKKKSRDPAHASTWAEAPKTYEGKKVSSFAYEIGDFGQISSESAYCVIPVVTCNAAGDADAEILVVVPTEKVKDWVAALAPKTNAKSSSFGKKVTYAPLTGLYVKLNGESALVVGELNDAVKKIKPSQMLENQKPNPYEGMFGKPKNQVRHEPAGK